MRATFPAMLCAVLTLLPCLSNGAEPVVEADTGTLVDEFDGELSLDWTQIRPDESHQSLAKSPGKLTITTQYGSIHRTGREPAKNLFLIGIPECDKTGFVVTTVLDAFEPRTPYNQAGLLIYRDDDNYLKFVCEFSSAGFPILNAILEQDGQSVITNFAVPFDLDRLWLRVTKRGDTYECASSSDGEHFVSYADLAWDDTPSQVGILAKNGSQQRAAEVEAHFDSFELRPLTEKEKDSPVPKERLALLGAWAVDSAERGGKPMTVSAVTNVVFEPGRLTLQEKTRSMRAACAINPLSSPKTLMACVRSGTTLTRLNWIYQLDGDKLTLCMILKPDADAPDSFETKEGDGLMLLKLHRVATAQ